MATTSLRIKKIPEQLVGDINLPISKSLSNRVLILEYLRGTDLNKLPISSANDSQILKRILLHDINKAEIDVEDAGTVARFILALCSVIDQKTRIIKGSRRMHQRPILPLVGALKQIGASVEYLDKDGFFPLKITGTNSPKSYCEIDCTLSSQFLTAILLISPKLAQPFQIKLSSNITSKPYAEMTYGLLKNYGISVNQTKKTLIINRQIAENSNRKILTEGDWSAAIYLLFVNALILQTHSTEQREQLSKEWVLEQNKPIKFSITNLNSDSIQGDRYIGKLLNPLGIELHFAKNRVTSLLVSAPVNFIELDFKDNPDLAQPFACYLAAIKKTGKLTGLHTLVHKETNRIEALKSELSKIGAVIQSTESTLEIDDYKNINDCILNPNGNICLEFETHNDHRMAMSLALVQIAHPEFEIRNPEVVSKSFPEFWKTLEELGFEYELKQ